MPEWRRANVADGDIACTIQWRRPLTEDDRRRLHALVDMAVDESRKNEAREATADA